MTLTSAGIMTRKPQGEGVVGIPRVARRLKEYGGGGFFNKTGAH